MLCLDPEITPRETAKIDVSRFTALSHMEVYASLQDFGGGDDPEYYGVSTYLGPQCHLKRHLILTLYSAPDDRTRESAMHSFKRWGEAFSTEYAGRYWPSSCLLCAVRCDTFLPVGTACSGDPSITGRVSILDLPLIEKLKVPSMKEEIVGFFPKSWHDNIRIGDVQLKSQSYACDLPGTL